MEEREKGMGKARGRLDENVPGPRSAQRGSRAGSQERGRRVKPGDALVLGAACGAVWYGVEGAFSAFTGYHVPLSLLATALGTNLGVGVLLSGMALLASRWLVAWRHFSGLSSLSRGTTKASVTTLEAAAGSRNGEPRGVEDSAPPAGVALEEALFSSLLLGLFWPLVLFTDPVLGESVARRLPLSEPAACATVMLMGAAVAVLALSFALRWSVSPFQSSALSGRLLPGMLSFSLFVSVYSLASSSFLPPLSDPRNPLAAVAFLLGSAALWVGLDRGLGHRLSQRRAESSRIKLTPEEPSAWKILFQVTVASVLISVVAAGLQRILDAREGISLLAAGPVKATDREKPDVVLIILSSTRADRLEAYGYSRPTSPHLKEFAHDALVFERAWAASPIALAAYASIFSGLYPFQHRADMIAGGEQGAHAHSSNLSGARALDEKVMTLAEHFRSGGYRTAAFFANSGYLDPAFGLQQGFEVYDARAGAFVERPPAALSLLHRLRPETVARLLNPFRTGHEINTLATAWLEAPSRRPSFLCVGYIEPHDPYLPPEDTARRLGPITRDWADPWISVLTGKTTLSEADSRELSRRYDAEVAAVDQAVGELLASLKTKGRLQRTVVAVIADHGEDLGEHGLFHHGLDIRETVLQVPFLLRYPDARLSGRQSALVHAVDVMPLLLEAASLPIPSGLPGKSLAELMASGSTSVASAGALSRAVFAQRSYSDRDVWNFGKSFAFERTCMRVEDHKYCQATSGEEWLYDLQSDPEEFSNLALLPAAASLRDVFAEHFESELEALVRSEVLPPPLRDEARRLPLGASLPAASMPAASMPAASMPAASMPAASMPADVWPATSVPPSRTPEAVRVTTP